MTLAIISRSTSRATGGGGSCDEGVATQARPLRERPPDDHRVDDRDRRVRPVFQIFRSPWQGVKIAATLGDLPVSDAIRRIWM